MLALVFVPLGVLALRAGGLGALRGTDLGALRFTLVQAALSAAASTFLAIPVARALARRRFPGRGAVIALMGAPFVLPVIVAVLGLIAVFGRAGPVAWAARGLGLEPPSIYGLGGVVLAHVFLNLPLAVRLILQGWQAVPPARHRLAASLGAGPRDVARLIEWPMLRATLPGVAAAIFLVCLTSFAVALTLGGGPRATTLELAIYEAFRLEFDLPRAATLALIQAGVGAAAVACGLALTLPEARGADLLAAGAPPGPGGVLVLQDAAVLAAAVAFIAAPLATVVARGATAALALPPSVWDAALRSLAVAMGSAALCMALALSIVLSGGRAAQAVGMAGIAVSPLAIGTGLFLLLRPWTDPAAWALPVTAAVNALMSLPFALRALAPAADRMRAETGRLADSLGLRGLARLRLASLPPMRREIGFAAGLAAALSMGDLGVVAFFAGVDAPTLPLQMYRLMGAYRMDDAMGAATVLLALTLALFVTLDRGIGRAGA